MKFLELYVGGLILWSIAYLIGKILLEKEKNANILYLIISIMVFALVLAFLNIIDSEILGGTIKIICVYCLQFLFYKIIFRESVSKTMTLALIFYIYLCLSEVILMIITSIIFKNSHDSMFFLKNTITMNLVIPLFELLIIKMMNRKLASLIRNSKFMNKSNIIMILIILLTLALLIFKIPVTEWKFNVEFIVTMIILFCFCLIGLFLLKQRSDIHRTKSMYQQLVEYSDITNKLLEDYRIVSHEHKNQLSIIRGMVDNSNQELIEYVDSLLDKRNIIKYQWIGELNHLSLSGLKGLMNYKLIEMESAKINTSISISKDLSKTKLNKLSTNQKDNLYSIMGIYLDNAIQASKNSKKKEISIEIYKENKDVVIIIANTYNGTIDLSKINDYGYTTKGKNHGVGLHIVKRILEEDKIFAQSTKLFQDYFIQELRIHLNEIQKGAK